MLRNYRLVISKQTLIITGLVAFSTIIVFVRMLYVENEFSYDYSAYIDIINHISNLSYFEILGSNLVFPYTVTPSVVPIEFGFSLLIKTISFFGFSPGTTFAIIASASVGVRVYTMRSLGVPVLWILWINIFAITLLEANALRLGVATSVLLLGLRQLQWARKVSGFLGRV